jgi:hypothetical protein
MYWMRLGTGRDRIWQLDTEQETETAGVNFFLAYSDDRTKTWTYMFNQFTDPGIDVMLCNAYINDTNATWH